MDIDKEDKGSGVKSVDMYYQKITESGKLFLFIFPSSIQSSFPLIFFFVLKKCQGKLDCLIHELFILKRKRPRLNTQSHFICAELSLYINSTMN